MSAKEERKPAFPTFWDKPVRADYGGISLTHANVQREILKLCPDPTTTTGQADPLLALDRAENRDKHREIGLLALSPDSPSMHVRSAAQLRIGHVYGAQPMKYGGPPVVLADGISGYGIDAEVRQAARIIFDSGPEIPGKEVMGTLRWMHDHVRDVVFQALEPHL